MQLETERLLLRRPQDGDLDAYAELFADPGVVRYTGGVTKSRAESQRTLERMIRHWDDHGIGLFSAVREEDDQVLGRVGFLVWDAESWRHVPREARRRRRSAGHSAARIGAAATRPREPRPRGIGRYGSSASPA